MKRGTQVRDRRQPVRRGMVCSDKDWGGDTTYVIWRGDRQPKREARTNLVLVSPLEQLAEAVEIRTPDV